MEKGETERSIVEGSRAVKPLYSRVECEPDERSLSFGLWFLSIKDKDESPKIKALSHAHSDDITADRFQ
jgi:hypothetical protein